MFYECDDLCCGADGEDVHVGGVDDDGAFDFGIAGLLRLLNVPGKILRKLVFFSEIIREIWKFWKISERFSGFQSIQMIYGI